MALILEVRDPRRAVPEYRTLATLPLGIGRALSNDVILDDPYVDARHARITTDETGAIVIEDLASVNGLRANGARLTGRLPVAPGMEVRVGRTTLRFRDSDEAVPPALVAASEVALPRAARWLLTTPGSFTLLAVLCGTLALFAWLATADRDIAGTVFAGVLGALVLIAIWAGVWSVATRGPDRRFHLMRHVAVVSAIALAMTLAGQGQGWLQFFFPDAPFVGLLYGALTLVAVTVLVAGHLTVAGALTRRGRWIAGGSVAALLGLIIVVAGAVSADKFSSVPHYPGRLEPVTPALVPTRSVPQFVSVMQQAKRKADDAATSR